MKNSTKKLLVLCLGLIMSLGLIGCKKEKEFIVDNTLTEEERADLEESEKNKPSDEEDTVTWEDGVAEVVCHIVEDNIAKYKHDYENGYLDKYDAIFYEHLAKLKDVKSNVIEYDEIYVIELTFTNNDGKRDEITLETYDKNIDDIKSLDDIKVVLYKSYNDDYLKQISVLKGRGDLVDLDKVDLDKVSITSESFIRGMFKIRLGYDYID